MEEDKNKGTGNPSPIPEKKPEGEKQPEVNHKAEIEKRDRLLAEKDEELRKKSERIKQAEFNIVALKKKAKEAGIELDDDKGLTEGRAREIFGEVIESKLEKKFEGFEQKTSEMIRGITAKKDASKGAGGSGGGQKMPQTAERPKFSPIDEILIRKTGLIWNGEKKVFIGPSGTEYKYVEGKGIISPMGEVAEPKKG